MCACTSLYIHVTKYYCGMCVCNCVYIHMGFSYVVSAVCVRVCVCVCMCVCACVRVCVCVLHYKCGMCLSIFLVYMCEAGVLVMCSTCL